MGKIPGFCSSVNQVIQADMWISMIAVSRVLPLLQNAPWHNLLWLNARDVGQQARLRVHLTLCVWARLVVWTCLLLLWLL